MEAANKAYEDLDPQKLTECKLDYYKKLEKATKTLHLKKQMSRKWIILMIQRVQTAESLINDSDVSPDLPAYAKEALENYEVIHKDKSYQLVTRVTKPGDIARVLVPWEESFEVVMKAHIYTKHGGIEEMSGFLEDCNYIVNEKCLPSLLAVCECKNDPSPSMKKPSKNYVSAGLVDLLDMTLEMVDGQFKYLLIYQDEKTNFVQLRPITEDNVVVEISVELIKLFSDLGPPQCIMVSSQLHYYFSDVIGRVNTAIYSKVDIDLNDFRVQKMSEFVGCTLVSWMKSTGTQTWATGCYLVQWNLNNQQNVDGITPYEQVFGHKAYCETAYLNNTESHTIADAEEPPPLEIPLTTTNNPMVKVTDLINNIIKKHGHNVTTSERKNSKKEKHTETTDIRPKSTEIINCCQCNEAIERNVKTCFECKNRIHSTCGNEISVGGDMKTVCFVCEEMEKIIDTLHV